MKKLDKLKTGLFNRNFALAKIMSGLAKDFYFSKKTDMVQKLGDILGEKADLLTGELGQLKGSFMKAGQILSLYAEDLLPAEVENLFTKLQGQTSYLKWEQISKEIPESIKSQLTIEETAFAAASIGQVHKAMDKEGNVYALKIQYKNIKKAIDTDLKIIKWIVKSINIIPSNVNLDGLFLEIKEMLLQEMDYEKEAVYMEKFTVVAHENFIIPKVNLELSTHNVICTEFIDGISLEEYVESANQNDRNRLASEYFELFFKEIFDWNMIQSDAHTGNYLIKDGRWVLLDFGATKEIEKATADVYRGLVIAIAKRDREEVFHLLKLTDVIDFEKSDMELLWNYFLLISEPLIQTDYDWGQSNIAKDAINMSREMQKKIRIKNIPAQNFYIDKKISGLFYILKMLGAKGDVIPRNYLMDR